MQDTSRRQIKSFSVQQFFKNAAEVWARSPHLRSKSNQQRETKQKSKRKSEESQLPLKSKGCNEIQGFRDNCDSQASWGCAPALPNQFRVVFLGAIQSVSHETLHQNRMTASNEPQANKKFFGAAVFQKCCRGVGEQPTFAKQIVFCNLFSLLQLHFLKLSHSQFDYFMK